MTTHERHHKPCHFPSHFYRLARGRHGRACRRHLRRSPCATPAALCTLVFTRLAALVDDCPRPGPRGQTGELYELGRDLRAWRLQHGCTRADLAHCLAIPLPQLVCLEHGLAQPGDLSPLQLCRLATVLASPHRPAWLTLCPSPRL